MGSDGSTRGDDPLSQRLADQNSVLEEADHEVHRAPEGEGVRAPMVQYGADTPQFSVFDGKGNEQVVVVTENDEGKTVQATGDTAADAMKKAPKQDTKIDSGFGPH